MVAYDLGVGVEAVGGSGEGGGLEVDGCQSALGGGSGDELGGREEVGEGDGGFGE